MIRNIQIALFAIAATLQVTAWADDPLAQRKEDPFAQRKEIQAIGDPGRPITQDPDAQRKEGPIYRILNWIFGDLSGSHTGGRK